MKPLLLPLALLLALASCNGSKKTADVDDAADSKYNPTDARTFGLLGDVKAVYIVEKLDEASQSAAGRQETVLKPQMTFDEYGRVTLDPYGNRYEYDADGNFIKGVSDKSVMSRDADGRITSYGNKESDNDREQYSWTFTYDADGRLLTVAGAWWEAMDEDSLIYEGENVSPQREVSSGVAEAESYDCVREYTYDAFDAHGNWTKRTCHMVYKFMIGGDESTADEERSVTTTERVIKYYSDPEEQQSATTDAADADRFTLDTYGFGFLGRVSECVTTSYTAVDRGAEALIPGDEVDGSRATISFTADGLVAEDPFGGVYVYDADGRFIKGVTEKSVMRRDDSHHVVYYQQSNDDEDDAMFRNEYTYDERGRLMQVVQTFWESTTTTTFTYEGDVPYPTQRRDDTIDEGVRIKSETNYRYTKFDQQGNWTERELRYQGSEEEDGAPDGPTRWNGAMIERRTISYHE